jgi:hypothetical protein
MAKTKTKKPASKDLESASVPKSLIVTVYVVVVDRAGVAGSVLKATDSKREAETYKRVYEKLHAERRRKAFIHKSEVVVPCPVISAK